MADEPSIDEILASLDQLLKEGEGRNDEPEEAVSPPAGELEAPHAHDAPTPHFFEVLDDEAEARHTDADSGEVGEGVDEAGPASPQVGESSEADAGAQGSRLYVLTDAMMVEDQPSLPLGMGGEPEADLGDEAEAAMQQALQMPDSAEVESEDAAEAGFEVPVLQAAPPEATYGEQPGAEAVHEHEEVWADAEPEPEAVSEDAAAQAMAWDEAEVQALVDQVTDDVCSAMAEQLPEMIRIALQYRLTAFIDARTKHQDTGNQE